MSKSPTFSVCLSAQSRHASTVPGRCWRRCSVIILTEPAIANCFQFKYSLFALCRRRRLQPWRSHRLCIISPLMFCFSYIVDYYICKALKGCETERKYRLYSAKIAFYFSTLAEYRGHSWKYRCWSVENYRNFWLKIIGIVACCCLFVYLCDKSRT